PGHTPPGGVGSPGAIAGRLAGAIDTGGTQFLDFGLLLVGALAFVLGLALGLNPAAFATRAGALGPAIAARGSVAGFAIATGGAAFCLLALVLLSRLPRPI